MEDQAMDYAAEEELKKLEEKLGMSTPAATPTTQSQAPTDSVDAQLEELEKRLQQGQQ